MKQLSLKSLSYTKNRDFSSILNQWKDFSTDSFILLFLEMKRRNISLTEENEKSFQNFLLTNQFTETSMINYFLDAKNVDSYEEFYIKETTPIVTAQSEAERKMRIQQSHLNIAKERKNGTKDIVFGGLIFGIGCIITLATLSNGSGYITYGAVIFGFLRMMKGVMRV